MRPFAKHFYRAGRIQQSLCGRGLMKVTSPGDVTCKTCLKVLKKEGRMTVSHGTPEVSL